MIEKRDNLKTKIKKEDISKYADHPLVKDFQSLFDFFPQLMNTLSNRVSDQEIVSTIPLNTKIPAQKFSEDNIGTPRNDPQRLGDGIDNSLTFQHKVLDDSISDLIDIDILTSPSKRKIKLNNGGGNNGIREKIQLENAYRLLGITYFPVVDPSDLQKNMETNQLDITREMIGIRLEIFNEKTSKYEPPNYILLKKKVKSDSWALFKHTIPVYLDVQSLFDSSNGGPVISYKDIYLFAKSVYVQLALGSKRTQKLQELEEEELIGDLKVDLEAAVASFVTNGLEVRLFLKEDQIISCFVKKLENLGTLSIAQLEVMFLGPLQDLKYKLTHLNNH